MPRQEGEAMTTQRLAVSVKEAAEMLGISRDLAYDQVKAGKLRAVRYGGRWAVSVKGLEEQMGIREASSAVSGQRPSWDY